MSIKPSFPGRSVRSFDMSSVTFTSLGSVVAAIAEPTPTAAAMSVQTISAYAFEVRSRFIVMFLPPRIKKAKVKRQKAYLFSRARFEIVTRIAMSWRHSSSRGADFRNELIH